MVPHPLNRGWVLLHPSFGRRFSTSASEAAHIMLATSEGMSWKASTIIVERIISYLINGSEIVPEPYGLQPRLFKASSGYVTSAPEAHNTHLSLNLVLLLRVRHILLEPALCRQSLQEPQSTQRKIWNDLEQP